MEDCTNGAYANSMVACLGGNEGQEIGVKRKMITSYLEATIMRFFLVS
jgi:hypothetical protein